MKTFLIAVLISSASFGQDRLANGNGVGNGGDVVTCKNSIEILDFTEAKILKRFKLIESPQSIKFLEVAKLRLLKLKPLDSRLFNQYDKVLRMIESRWKLIDNASFRDVPDSFEIALPEGCHLEQLAIQQEIEGKTQIHISKKLWDQLNPLNQAGLLLHEIIYEHFIALGEKNSIKARKFNAFLFSKEIETNTKGQYQNFVRDLGVKLY